MSANQLPKVRTPLSPRPTPNPNAVTRAVRPPRAMHMDRPAGSEFRMPRSAPQPAPAVAPVPRPIGIPQPVAVPKPAVLPWIQRFASIGRFLEYAGASLVVFSVAQDVFLAVDEIDRQLVWMPGPIVDPAVWDDPHAAAKEAQRRFGAIPIGDLRRLQEVRERQNHYGAPPMVVMAADGSEVRIPRPGQLNGYAQQLDRDANGDGSIIDRAQDELALIEIDLRRRQWEAVLHPNDNATQDTRLQDLELEILRLVMDGKLSAALLKRLELDDLKRLRDAASSETSPVPRHLQIKASVASAPSSASADKTWCTEGGEPMPSDWDKKAPRGERRWYIEKTPNGFRVTQLQEGNGSGWRPLKLRDNPIPVVLQAKLDGLNIPIKPQRAMAQVATRTNSEPLPVGPNPQVISDNTNMLKDLPDGVHTYHANANGQLNASGSPFLVDVLTDPKTNLRRWKVTSQGSASVPINLQRAIDRLSSDWYQHDQLVDMLRWINQHFPRIQVAQASRTGSWQRVTSNFSSDYNHGQAGYALRFVPQRDGQPPRWEVEGFLSYSRQEGWQAVRSGRVPPPALVRAITAANQKFAAEFVATPQRQPETRTQPSAPKRVDAPPQVTARDWESKLLATTGMVAVVPDSYDGFLRTVQANARGVLHYICVTIAHGEVQMRLVEGEKKGTRSIHSLVLADETMIAEGTLFENDPRTHALTITIASKQLTKEEVGKGMSEGEQNRVVREKVRKAIGALPRTSAVPSAQASSSARPAAPQVVPRLAPTVRTGDVATIAVADNAQQVEQLVQIIGSNDVRRSGIVFVAYGSAWFVFQTLYERYQEGQLGYELSLSDPESMGDDGSPQWELAETMRYSARDGWTEVESRREPPNALVHALRTVNTNLAREFEAKSASEQALFAAAIAQAPAQPLSILSDGEIQTNAIAMQAAIDAQTRSGSGFFYNVVVDEVGRVVNTNAGNGRFDIMLKRVDHTDHFVVRHISGTSGKFRWEARANYDHVGKLTGWNTTSLGSSDLSALPKTVPIDAIERTVTEVNLHPLWAEDVAKIAQALSTDPVKTFMFDSTGRVDGNVGMRFEVTLRWDEKQRWAETTHVEAYDPDGQQVVWTATLENGAYTYRRGDIESCRVSLPSEFPSDAYRATLDAVREKMPTR